MKNCSDLGIRIALLNLIICKTYKLVAEVVNPCLILGLVQNVLSAPVVRLYGKSFLVLVYGNLVVIDGNLQILTGNTLVHDNLAKFVHRVACIKNIVHKENLVSVSEVVRGIGPAVNKHLGFLSRNKGVAASGNNGGVQNRSSVFFLAYNLEILGDYVCKIHSASQGYVDDIRNEMILNMHLVSHLKGTVSDYIM